MGTIETQFFQRDNMKKSGETLCKSRNNAYLWGDKQSVMIELRPYQADIAARAAQTLRSRRMVYLSMEVRTGKTFTALAAAEMYGATRVLFVSKLKALNSITEDYRALAPSFSLETVNYESAHKVGGAYDLVILDEAHSLGAFPRPSKRAKSVKALCKNLPIIYLSGTPTPESFSQLYHQFWVSSYSPWRLFTTFYKWAKVYVDVVPRRINGYDVNDYSHARKDRIDRDVRGLFIDYTQKDAGFETSITEDTLTVPMAPRTAYLLHALQRDRVVSEDGLDIVADTPVKLMGKLHQLSSGTVIGEDGTHHITDPSKAQFLRVRFAGKRLAVFYVYQSEADLLKEYFPDWTDSPEEFQRAPGASKVFLGQVRSAREGVRLDTADALVFFNLEYSYLSYEQGRNRLMSKEREKPARVYFLCSDCGIEGDILEAVHGKSDFTYAWFKSKRAAR